MLDLTPVGQALKAKENGQRFFELQMTINKLVGRSNWNPSSGGRKEAPSVPDVLGAIEEVGWRLEHVGYVSVEPTAASTYRTPPGSVGSASRVTTEGIYLFRNTDAPDS
ncbi:hypothetical protein M6D93_11885 [Jatrophihabitans telluris]|uniref:PASTA domain-containing protein n=1 Tax=Jatrophihabitans telluris TaxID=2038343 RepID=A0ABY4QVE4_9ACTN|nr:hypothetical protein [Jatrophihabitans telluris]UQX87006.1 hypothetical protein M6D93_11885 [Jatrophihabitans telluris]